MTDNSEFKTARMTPTKASISNRPATIRPAAMPDHGVWDFNDAQQSLPSMDLERDRSLEVRRFATLNNDELFGYLAKRSISTAFLVEIDQFIRSHPELAECRRGRDWIKTINTLSPIDAYKYFLRGFTRPARYVDGIVTSNYLTLPAGFHLTPLRNKHDPELVEFFEGFEFRDDILDKIDNEVAFACHELSYGRIISCGLRRLVCYALWGNPVDAYKWFEYNYQEEHMPHRYLPEHVILGEIQKPGDYTEPGYSAIRPWRRHRNVRWRMAKAKDQGVDVIEVLMSEYRLALIRKGYRRVDIDILCTRAQNRLDSERQYPTDADIVDMIMDDAVARLSVNRPVITRTTYSQSSQQYSAPLTIPKAPIKKSRLSNAAVPSFLRAQAAELREEKANLQRLYTQEANALASSRMRPAADTQAISASRGTTERRYVNCLVRYLRNAKRITSGEASELQRRFRRENMVGIGPINKDYLLGMYPRELE